MSLTELLALLERMASVPSEDLGISELDHGLQCAFELSSSHPADVELQIAGLVHDIGHAFAQPGAESDLHGSLGAQQLRPLFGSRVADLVAAHIPAKRYLVAHDPAYAGVLSPVSTMTLQDQGGSMNAFESAQFESSAIFSDAVALRRADDAAKVPDRVVPDLAHWLALLHTVSR